MISLVQRKSNHSLSGSTVSVTFTSNVTAGNGLLAAVTWIDPNNSGSAYPAITVHDSIGSWALLRSETIPLGGDVYCGIYFFPRVSATGPNGAVIATSSSPGLMFISIHEVAPNASEILKVDVSGGNFGLGWDTTFSDLTNDLLTNAPPNYNVTEYEFAVFGTRSGNIGPTGTGGGTPPTLREYEVNTTAVGAMNVLGSQATLDRISNDFGLSPVAFVLAWSYPSSIVCAVLATIASVTPVADPPTSDHASGEYSAHQTVTLSQDQGLDIRYTLDGTTPTSSSTLYTAPIAINSTTTIKAIGTQPASGWPVGFWTDSSVAVWTLDIYTGVCLNPNNVIDGDDTTFATLTCGGAAGDVVAVKASMMNGTTGGPGHLKIDFEVTQNDLVAATQTLPAWKVSAFVGGVETILASAVPGAGVVARNIVSLAVTAGVSAPTMDAKISAICQIPGSTGGVQLKVYGAYFVEP